MASTDDFSGLTINLARSEPNRPSQKRKAEGTNDEEESTLPQELPPRQKRNRDDQRKNMERSNASSEEFISSLFNHNPDIPQLDLSEVSPLHEDVFTTSSFSGIGVHPYLVQNLQQNCLISQMTSVQAKAIPIILAGKDALIKSQTGSGKTLAYALPIIQKLQEVEPKVSRQDGVFALVIVPTRELAIQSFELFEKLCKSFARIVPGMLSGGEKKKSEKARLRKGINILVATPGRLIDHIQHTKCLSLKNLRWLVLDEADRMLELGYERDVQSIITSINEQLENSGNGRQTLLLSATLTTGIEQLSEVSMKHPTFIDAAVNEENKEESLKTLTTPDQLKQTFIICPAKLRLVTLAAFVLWKCRFSRARKVLIFLSTQDMVDFHAELFDRCLNSLTNDGKIQKTKKKKKKRFGRMYLTDDAKAVLGQGGMDEQEEEEEDDDEEEDQHDNIELLKLHGNMTQKDRLTVFNAFRESTSGVLFCTDVAARGLDLPQVDWIVQYNPPTSKADYVHRVGRTARIGTKGSSLLFLLPSEANFVKELEAEKLMLAEMTIEQVLQKLFKHGGPKTGRGPFTMEEAATDLQMKLESAVASDSELHERASQAYVSYVRSYASYPRDIRHIFCFKELHLGHIAKSYALRDPPTKITGLGKGQWVSNDKRKRHKSLKQEEHIIKAQKKRINQKGLVMSEYSSGFDGIDPSQAKPKRKSSGRKFIRHPRNV